MVVLLIEQQQQELEQSKHLKLVSLQSSSTW
jgi:hypothetical protein